MTSTSSKRAAPPKRLSLTPGRSFQLSSPPPPRSAGSAAVVASTSFTSSPVQSHHRHSLHRASSISYTTNSNSRTLHRQFENDHPPHSASEATTTTVTGTVAASTEPLTLADRHSTLLFQIAEKESKCLELRTQLLQHERELAALKQRWERVLVASSSTSNVSHAAKSMSMSMSSAREPAASITSTNTRHSISEESTSSSSDSSPSVTTPSDEIPALSPSPARIALPGTLGLSMMYKELSAGIVKSDKLRRASLFLNDMLTSALTAPAPISAAPTGAPVTDSTASEHDTPQTSTTTIPTATTAKPSEPAVSRTECTPRRRSRDIKKTLTLLDDDIEWSSTQSVPNPTLTPDIYPRSSNAVLQPVSSSVNVNSKSAAAVPKKKDKADKAQGPTDFDDDWNW